MPVDQALVGVRLHRGKTLPGDASVFIHAGFGGQIPFALTEATVVDGQHRIAHGAQLRDAKRLAREVPAYAVQVEDGRCIAASGRPPPGMQVLPGLEAGGLDIEFLNVLRQAAIPARVARFDAEQQLALFVFERTTTHRQADDQHGHAQQRQPASTQTSEEGSRHRTVQQNVKHGF
ncbi:hypothetical protein D3C73_1275340 [compost metagenome]